jgi:hypothetical protein
MQTKTTMKPNCETNHGYRRLRAIIFNSALLHFLVSPLSRIKCDIRISTDLSTAIVFAGLTHLHSRLAIQQAPVGAHAQLEVLL